MRVLLVAIGLLGAEAAHAQYATPEPGPIQLVQFDEPTSATFQPPVIPDPITAKASLTRPRRVVGGPVRDIVYGRDPVWKPSWVKQTRASVTYFGGDADGFSWTTVNVLAGLKRPSSRAFSITPNFSAHFTDSPIAPGPNGLSDLPSTLYDASVDIGVGIPLDVLFGGTMPANGPPRWIATVAAAPGWYSDGENTDDAVRVPARGLVIYNRSPEWSYAFGAVWLDREDVSILPALGFVWTPNPSFKLDAILPRPKVAYRFQQTATVERWATLSGEFGGGQWAIRRNDTGENDTLRLSAINVLAGIENRSAAGITWTAQFGLSLGRELEYESGIGDRDLDATGLFRITGSF